MMKIHYKSHVQRHIWKSVLEILKEQGANLNGNFSPVFAFPLNLVNDKVNMCSTICIHIPC